MSSHTSKYPRSAPAAISGLGLTTQLAAAATDGIPIAKLVLGVVSRIATLASDIEKSRDALHQLAEDARKTGEKIPAAVSGRKLGPEIERSLGDIYEVLGSIETVLKEHKAKNTFQKALSYAFTTSKRIDGLSQELSRATQELLWVAALDTNALVRENSPYIGEFMRIRLCDVDELTLITERQICRTGYSWQIYSGRVKGHVVVLRCFARKFGGRVYGEEELRREIIGHDQLLEKLSTDPSLHRSIARLYGKNSREHFDRFNVINSLGCLPIPKVSNHPPTIDSTWNIIRQLLDAAFYLNERGLSWYPQSEADIYVNAAGVPIIGLHNDLRSFDTDYWHIVVLGTILEEAYSAHWEQSCPSTHSLDIIFGTAPAPKGMFREKTTVARRLIPTLNAKLSTYIINAHQSLWDPSEVWTHTGSVILHAAASGFTVGSTFYTMYSPDILGCPFMDDIFMVRVDQSDEAIVHRMAATNLSSPIVKMLRTQLGIAVEGLRDHTQLLDSFRDPAEPASMQFTLRSPRKSA